MRPRGDADACRSRSPGCSPARRRASPSRRSMSASSTSPATRRRIRSTTSSARSSSRPEIRDLYGYLIDGMQGTRGAIRSGGDDAGERSRASRRRRSRSRATRAWSRSAPDGTAERRLRHPGLQRHRAGHGGRLDEGRGSAAPRADVIVRDPVVRDRHAAALPVGRRPVALLHAGRQCRGAGRRLHPRSSTSTGRWSLAADALRKTVRLEAGAKAPVDDPGDGGGPGHGRRRREAHRARTSRSTQSFALAVQPGTAALVRRTVRPLEAGASLTVSSDLLADILPGTGAVSVSVSPLAGARRAGRCCRRSTATPMAAPSRSSAGRCRCSTSTSSPRRRRLALDAKRRRARARRDRARAGAPGLERRLRPVVGRRRRHLARRLCHRLPDPGARARLRRAAAAPSTSRSTACATSSPTRPRWRRTAPTSPMRPMCWPATAGR